MTRQIKIGDHAPNTCKARLELAFGPCRRASIKNDPPKLHRLTKIRRRNNDETALRFEPHHSFFCVCLAGAGIRTRRSCVTAKIQKVSVNFATAMITISGENIALAAPTVTLGADGISQSCAVFDTPRSIL